MIIDFDAVRAASLTSAESLLRAWLPRGKRRGREFLIGNLRGDSGDSMRINLDSGKWADFADGTSGFDLIDLRAAMAGSDRATAAREIAEHIGLNGPRNNGHDRAEAPSTAAEANGWQPIVPAPSGTPRPDALLGRFDRAHEYRGADGRTLFYIGRTDARNGQRKSFTPLTFGTLAGATGWHRKACATPRPLYGLDRLAKYPTAPVILCEGEKAADAAQELLPSYACMTWPGGAEAVKCADFMPLLEREVIIWPDADPPGARAAKAIARKLPHARILRVADLANGADAADVIPDNPEAWLRERLPLHDEAPKADALWVDDSAWSESDIPKRPWIAPGYALRGAVTLLTGPPSAMKSSLMLAWACSLALGRDFGRFRPTQPGSVIVYNVEDDRAEQRRRLSAALRQFGAVPSDIAGKVIRVGPSGIGTLLTHTDKGTIVDTEAMTRLRALIAERKPVAFIADPLAELHTAEENDNTALRAVIAALRALAAENNTAVIVLHHTRKGAATAGDPDISRGASAIIGAVRIALTLTSMSEDDARTFGLPADYKSRSGYVRLDDAKQNYAPIREAEWFSKAPYLLDNDERVPAAVPWTPPQAKTATKEDLASLATAIARGTPSGVPWSPKLSGEPRSVRALLDRHGFVGPDAQRATLRQLHAECHVEEARYLTRQRKPACGLRIGDQPPADWRGEGTP